MNHFLSFFFLIVFFPPQGGAQTINTETLNWKPLSYKKDSSIHAALESPSKKTTLTYRQFSDDFKNTSLKSKVNKWLKDYISYGFNLEKHRPLILKSGAKGFYVEAHHKDLDQNFNQFMTLNENKLVTLTCKSKDQAELEDCKQAILTFSWKTNQESLK